MRLQQVLGLTDEVIDTSCQRICVPVHKELVEPLLALQKSASKAGFDMQFASGWRGFDRQLAIWNKKASGQGRVLDSDEEPLDIHGLTERELVWAILRWSALPGGSRHHWGSEVDVFEKKAMPQGYQLQLTQKETLKGGIFYEFYQWLDAELARARSKFFRPYLTDRGGVAPEPWHLSYRPLACQFEQALSFDELYELILQSEMVLKETVLSMLDEIWPRFILPNEKA